MTDSASSSLSAPPAPPAASQSIAAFPVDPDHGGLRLVVIVAFFVIGIAAFALTNALVANEGLNLLAVFVGLIAGYLGSLGLERALRRRWRSGRTVHVRADGVTLGKTDKTEVRIAAGARVDVLRWKFRISRKARVPKGWYVYAAALYDGDVHLPVYTFYSPDQAERYATTEAGRQFTLLRGRKDRAKETSGELRLASEERRLLDAENFRWIYGAEMTQDDFNAFLVLIETHYPEWKPIE
jgi:hypothetical protein